MLYIVLLPVKKDNVRNLAVIHAENYGEVMGLLSLPRGWMGWVSLTDIELEAVMQSPHHYVTKFIQKDKY